jgi:glutathione S-transferase
MPIDPNAEIEITCFSWVPEGPRGLVKDLRVRWALEEAGLNYRVRAIGLERPADYRKDQPYEQVPCLRDGAVRIFESGAIVQYIGEKSDALLPTAPQEKYRAIQWSYASLSSVELFVQQRVLLNSFWADQEWAAPAKPTFDHYARLRLRQVSDWLADKQWLEGDRFTIGDLIMVTTLRFLRHTDLVDQFPNLAGFLKRGEARPAFLQALSDQLAAFREHQPEGVAA